MFKKRPRTGPPAGMSAMVRLFGVLLIFAIVAGALLSCMALRSKEIEDWRRDLKSTTYLLTEHTSQTVFSAFLVLDALTERVKSEGLRSEDAFRARMATVEVHQLLRDKIQGLPQLDVASVIAANGDNINFSRSYPVPAINLAERDYFKAHRENAHLGDYISTSVRNKGNGKWTFYISRRLNDAQGRFMGLVLVGLSVDAFTGVYGRLVRNLGDGASITLYRSDLTCLARSPHTDEIIGKINQSGVTHDVITLKKEAESVVLADSPRFSNGSEELRLTAVRKVDRYPLVLTVVVPESIFLAGWKRSVLMIAVMSVVSIAFVITGISVITRNSRRRERIERELRESETKFHTMVDWATDWEYWVRTDGSIHYMTPSGEQFTGYSVAEFEAHPALIDTLIHPDDQALWRRICDAARAATESSAGDSTDLRIIQKNGALR